ncbi:DUF6265 family protein [Tellurirhabdus rosea]|uniref:DUF6265 family protein n=1 Tax=Tellurirhabdus rosea TaxID=2674997 RepID=UPI0022554D65|nr:DUF6265 family protein [Tellurirhabdus rosea]
MKKYLLTALLSGGLLASVVAQTASRTGTLADMQFIAGHWQGTHNGGPIEAAWTDPSGDNIMGMIRMMKDGKVTLYEVFAFEQTATGPVVMVKHFKPGLIGVEEKDKSDRYVFLEASKNRAIYEKQGGDPLRVLYERRSPNQLVIALGRQQDGNWQFKDLFVFQSK